MVVEIAMYDLNVKGSMKHVIELFWNLSEVEVLQEVTGNKKGKDWVNWFKEAWNEDKEILWNLRWLKSLWFLITYVLNYLTILMFVKIKLA